MNPSREYAYHGDAEIWRARYEDACARYAAGDPSMRHTVFLATLYGLGFRNQELMAEEALHRTERSVV